MRLVNLDEIDQSCCTLMNMRFANINFINVAGSGEMDEGRGTR